LMEFVWFISPAIRGAFYFHEIITCGSSPGGAA
jgi:hypothetical protein